MNKVIIMGRLTADPVLRETQSGIASVSFTVAVNRKFKDKNTGEYPTDFIRCNAWRQTAEFISRYFSKGSMIALEGTIQSGSYKDKNYSDVTHYTQDVLVENVEFCGSKNDTSGQPQNTQQNRPQYNSINDVGKNNTAASVVAQAQQAGIQTNSLDDFVDVLDDGQVPF